MEIWKDVIGYKGVYQISSLGRLKSFKCGKVKILKPCVSGHKLHPYYTYGLSLAGSKTFYAHQLVAIHFIENPKNYPHINHKDRNTLNNIVSNLEWVTHFENHSHKSKDNPAYTSKLTGVHYHSSSRKWLSAIFYKGKVIRFGSHRCETSAYVARIKFENNNKISNKYS